MIFAYFIYFKSLSVLSLRLCLELFFSHYWTEPFFEPTSCGKEPFPAAMVAGFTIRRLQIGKEFHLSISCSAEVIPKTFSCYLPCRLRVVPHLSPGIVERAKRERVWKSLHARKGYTRRDGVSPFSRGVIFTRARVSLALLSMRKNGGLLVVCLPCYRVRFVLKNHSPVEIFKEPWYKRRHYLGIHDPGWWKRRSLRLSAVL